MFCTILWNFVQNLTVYRSGIKNGIVKFVQLYIFLYIIVHIVQYFGVNLEIYTDLVHFIQYTIVHTCTVQHFYLNCTLFS
jgi:hypothetical protein